MEFGKKYATLNEKLQCLYEEAYSLMQEDTNSELFQNIVAKVNKTYCDQEQVLLQISDPAVKDSLVNEVQTLHESKAKFDQKASQWLERANVDASKVASILSVSRSLRSKTRSNISCSSSVLKARAVAKEEVARLRLVQLQEKQSLLEAEAAFKRKRDAEEAELRRMALEAELKRITIEANLKRQREAEEAELERNRELLKATHELKEASIERQVFEEELERGGYIPADDVLPETSQPLTPSPGKLLEKSLVFSNPLNLDYDFNVNAIDQPSAERDRPATQKLDGSNDIDRVSELQIPSETRPQLRESMNAVVDVMKEAMAKPNLELFKFDGNPTTYSRFIFTFETAIEQSEPDDRRKLLYLIQHCTGKAKSLIEYCLLLNPAEGLAKAKQVLYENFGKKNTIARAYIKTLLDGPDIKYDDSNALISLSQKLEECSTTLEHLHYFSDLNCSENIAKIVRRLPASLQTRWLRFSAAIESEGREPNFVDLKRFVLSEANIVKSSYSTAVGQKSKKTVGQKVTKFSTHSTLVSGAKNQQSLTNKCAFCLSNHSLWDCSEFRRKPVQERLQFMRQKRLCDNCGKRGHVAKYCFSRPACTVVGCNRKHHSLLHCSRREASPATPCSASTSTKSATATPAPTAQPTTNATSNFTGASAVKSNSNVFLNVIPVEVVTCGKSMMTYAFLDQGSTTSLCDKRLLDQLQVSGEPAKFSISTVNEQTLRQGCKVNLTVCSLAGNETLVLRDVLSVDRLPVSPNPSLSTDELKAWPHLQNISFPVVQGEVLLLIGLNAPEAFWVAEERRGATDQPYAVRTTLGWSIVGPKFIGNQESSVSVNFVSTSEQLINSQIECLWRLDRVPSRQSYDTSMSKEDRYALQLLQNSKSVVDGHYQVALPWRPGAPRLKNNYEQARVRLSYLKRRLMKDSSLKSRYVDAVSSYISQGHAEQVEPELESDTKWYLPHHPVLHPHKPKIRVVFDCGAEFAGNSLNSQLLKGPDFMSSLIGVLTRFRKENVAVVGDIKEMFHQVFVDPKDRQYLRFLWWPGGDLTSEPVTHQMNVHLFGATSSPACAQFSLLQSAEDQKNEFDDEVRQLIRRNFYMDDCLFSAPTIGEVVRLAHEVSELLRKRGFQLTKWIVKGAGTVRKVLGACLFCKRRNVSFGVQYMADLPLCRVTSGNAPFYFTGIDFFGPIMVKQNRSQVKRYGCVFTCLTMRAVHLEVGFSLETDAFINVLRRFIIRRGKPHMFYSDNGTNIVGGYKELRRSLQELNQSVIEEQLKQQQIRWNFNPPYASHVGGIWERVIRSIKRVLSAITTQQPLTDDALLTLFSEAEHVVNSRPLTPITMYPEGEEPLTPNHLLMFRPTAQQAPGKFDCKDNFVRKRWRQIQYLSDLFWHRWRREYLQTLQTRQKWSGVKPNFAIGDVVLLADTASPRGKWPLGRIIQIFPDDLGHVRQVMVKSQNKTFRRPISKPCKLI